MTKQIQRFDFEGRQLTVSEMRDIVPRFSASNIRQHLKAGRNTRQAMLYHNPAVGRAKASRKNGEAWRMQGWRRAGFES